MNFPASRATKRTNLHAMAMRSPCRPFQLVHATLWAIVVCSTNASATSATTRINVPNGVATPHTNLVAHWVQQLPPSAKPRSEGLALRCFETQGHSDVIGVAHGLVIRASVKRVVSIIEDYDHYKDLFEDTISVRTRPIPNGLVESWEQKAPMIFLPNTRFSINTLIHDELPQRKIWHSRLVSSNQLLGNDVFVAVYPLDTERTYYWEVDFINAKWGIASSVAMGSIWSGAVESTVVSDLDIKFHAENPSWRFAQVRDFAKKRVDARLVDQCVKHRVPLDLTREPALREP